MKRKIPSNAFDVYFAMGSDRSYRVLAERLGVSKQAITKVAGRERWQERAEKIEEHARSESHEKAVDALGEMNERHLKVLRAVQGKALETLRETPLRTGMDAVRALEMTIKQERLIRGEPSERTEMNVEEVTRREMQRWMIMAGDEAGDTEDGDGDVQSQ